MVWQSHYTTVWQSHAPIFWTPEWFFFNPPPCINVVRMLIFLHRICYDILDSLQTQVFVHFFWIVLFVQQLWFQLIVLVSGWSCQVLRQHLWWTHKNPTAEWRCFTRWQVLHCWKLVSGPVYYLVGSMSHSKDQHKSYNGQLAFSCVRIWCISYDLKSLVRRSSGSSDVWLVWLCKHFPSMVKGKSSGSMAAKVAELENMKSHWIFCMYFYF